MERVEDFIRRYQERNQKDRLGECNDDEWLRLEKELDEIWKNATDEEKKLLSKRIAFESFYMVCQGIRYDREKKKAKTDK